MKKQKEIKILGSEVEAVRKLPDVYIGALGNKGFINMIREIIQNCFDEQMKGNNTNPFIRCSYDEITHIVSVEDFGQGIPYHQQALVFSKLHSSSNYDKEEGSGEYSSGKNGMGATITNFLSKAFVVESFRVDEPKAHRVSFVEGELTKEEDFPNKDKRTGLRTVFQPSDMMGDITVTSDDVYNLIWKIIKLCKIGTKVEYTFTKKSGKSSTVMIENNRGIYEILDMICPKSLVAPIYMTYDNGTMKADILLTYDAKDINDQVIMSFGNTCPTDGGTHVDGFSAALIKYFKNYMNKIFLVNNRKKLVVNNTDICTGLRAVVSVYHIKPLFSGQSKEVFSKEDMKPFVAEVVANGLNEWAAAYPADLQKIATYIKNVCEIRSKQDTEKVKMADSYKTSVISGLPDKYIKPNKKGYFELIICEGDSAAAGMQNNRNKDCQGIFPIRGKMPNPYTTPTKKYFENEEVAGICKLCGYDKYQKNFDPNKFKPDKVIIAADADADADHIKCLVLGFFLRYMPFAVEAGKIYTAIPPLYGVEIGGKMNFYATEEQYAEYITKEFSKKYSIYVSGQKKPMTKEQIIKLLVDNKDYRDILESAADNHAVEPELLEFLLINKDLPQKQLESKLKKVYRFMTTEKRNNTIIVTGAYNGSIKSVFMNQNLFNDCAKVLNFIRSNSSMKFVVDGYEASLYQLMMLFKKFTPDKVTRYKGLGEMPPTLLGSSTIIPGMGRTIRQYTSEDAESDFVHISGLQANKSVFLNMEITASDLK